VENKMELNQMADNKTIERIQQEVVSPNKDRLYQATLKEVNSNKPIELPVAFEVQELKMKHDNWLLDEQMKMIKRELITMINERKGE